MRSPQHGDAFTKAAPFKRNDAMLDVLPIGVIVFAGTGIPLLDFRKSGA